MKVLVLYEYPPCPGGLSTQGDMLYRGLLANGVDVHAAHLESDGEKEWYYRWFRPDVVVGIGYWGHTPQLVLHPQSHGMQPIPWFVADGYIANHKEALNRLPLILVTSHWVKEVYIRDGIEPDRLEVLPVGIDTDQFRPRDSRDPKVLAIREMLGIAPETLMILTVGGDAASKGAQEVMRALARIDSRIPEWRYVCKVWPQERTYRQNELDRKLAEELGISRKVIYRTGLATRNYMPFMTAACDLYAGPSRLEGFGMPHVEAGACEKPVVAIRAMAFLDTLLEERTALLAGIAETNLVTEVELDPEPGTSTRRRIVFDPPRIADYRADVGDLSDALLRLMTDPELRRRLGETGRQWVVEQFDYRVVARRFAALVAERLGIT